MTSSGTETLTWNSFPSITDGTTYSRFRLSTDSALDTIEDGDSIGQLSDGEVEDYQLTIQGVDYGDAPDTGDNTTGTGDYLTTETNGGAAHVIDSNLKLGTNLDADSGTLQGTDATADDLDSDDEDGIIFTSVLGTNDTSYSVSVDVTNNNATEDATLIGWIDFDRDGNFEASEAVSQTIAANSGQKTTTLDWAGLSGLTDGDTYARFRLSTDSAFDIIEDSTSVGLVSDGEVEDYLISIKNTLTADDFIF